jgi:hypothetical protein
VATIGGLFPEKLSLIEWRKNNGMEPQFIAQPDFIEHDSKFAVSFKLD